MSEPRVTIFDYGAGNLHSLGKALRRAGERVTIEPDARRAVRTDVLVLPGVGAFGAASARIGAGRAAMRDAIIGGLPTIGICLGMQLFFDCSDEGDAEGLGVIGGRVTPLRARRVPQIGWNAVEAGPTEPAQVSPPDIAYFANGYACRPLDERCVTAWSQHESDRFPAIVRAYRAIGVQFHPEKSSAAGVSFLHALLDDALTEAVR